MGIRAQDGGVVRALDKKLASARELCGIVAEDRCEGWYAAIACRGARHVGDLDAIKIGTAGGLGKLVVECRDLASCIGDQATCDEGAASHLSDYVYNQRV